MTDQSQTETHPMVLKYREIGRTLTQQVEWEKIEDLRRGNLYMTLPNSPHFRYVEKFIQPLLLDQEPVPGVIGIVSLSVRMASGDHAFRKVTHWTIEMVRLSMNGEYWMFSLGGEVK